MNTLFTSRFTLQRPHLGMAFVAVLLGGCGGAPTGQVTGKITLQGIPVGGADLKFASVAEANDIFFGVSDPKGNYQVSYRTLDGLPVGKYKVLITAFTIPGGIPFPPGERADALKNEGKLIATSYEFEKEIAAGANSLDFELAQGKQLESTGPPNG